MSSNSNVKNKAGGSKPDTASGNASKGVGPSRRTWDKDEFSRKASSREKREQELAELNAARKEQGLPPMKRLRPNLPEPTSTMKERTGPLNLDANQGKTLMVDMSTGNATDGKTTGQTGPGFYCSVCRKLLKDNLAYLDHINGRIHLMRIGQSTQQDRATVQQVKDKLALLRQQYLTENGVGGLQSKSAAYDFDARIKAIAEQEEREREEKRRKKREERQRKKQNRLKGHAPSPSPPLKDHEASAQESKPQETGPQDDEDAMMAAMGFGGFGSTKKR